MEMVTGAVEKGAAVAAAMSYGVVAGDGETVGTAHDVVDLIGWPRVGILVRSTLILFGHLSRT